MLLVFPGVDVGGGSTVSVRAFSRKKFDAEVAKKEAEGYGIVRCTSSFDKKGFRGFPVTRYYAEFEKVTNATTTG